jgi:hypothetical protein
MWEAEQAVDIQVPLDEVYRRLKAFTRHTDFADALVSVEQITSGPVGVGTRFRAQERVPGTFVSVCEITVLEAPRLIGWKAWVDGVMRTEWEFRLSPTVGGTCLVQTSRWQPMGPIGGLLLHLHRKRNVPRENRRTLDRIKAVLEAQPAAPKAA